MTSNLTSSIQACWGSDQALQMQTVKRDSCKQGLTVIRGQTVSEAGPGIGWAEWLRSQSGTLLLLISVKQLWQTHGHMEKWEWRAALPVIVCLGGSGRVTGGRQVTYLLQDYSDSSNFSIIDKLIVYRNEGGKIRLFKRCLCCTKLKKKNSLCK